MKNPLNQLGPTYFEKFTTYENEDYFKDLNELEWRGQIQSSSHNKKFRIKYYGNLHEEHNLIMDTDFSPCLIVAEDVESQEEIVLFDGCTFGYNGMFAYQYSKEQMENRPTENRYIDKNGNDIFELLISVFYNIPYDEEMDGFINEHNRVELISGESISPEELKRNGYDWFYLYAIDEQGNFNIVVDEELA